MFDIEIEYCQYDYVQQGSWDIWMELNAYPP